MTFGTQLVLVVLLLLLATVLFSFMYNNRTLVTTSPVVTDYAPSHNLTFHIESPATDWLPEYMRYFSYTSTPLGQYYVRIHKPIHNIRLETLIYMADGADVIISDSGSLDYDNFQPDLLITTQMQPLTTIRTEIDKFFSRHDHSTDPLNITTCLNMHHHRRLLQGGCPVRIGRICILSSRCLYSENVYPSNKTLTVLAPDCILPTIAGNISKIPKLIHQTYETRVIPVKISACISAWTSSNPDYTYKYYTGEDCRDFLATHFDSSVLQAYDSLYPGAFKADLWRCCVLYVYGGVYIDAKLFPADSLSKIISPDADLLLVLDYPLESRKNHDIYNAFMASTPQHPFMLDIITTIVSNVQKRHKAHKLDITGPMMVGTRFKEYLIRNNISYDHKAGIYRVEKEVLQMLSVQPSFVVFNSVITKEKGVPVIYHRYVRNDLPDHSKIYMDTTGKEHYSKLFNQDRIYI